jgi:hypothetical protein
VATDTPTYPRLLLSAPEAARALNISQRTLWTFTVPRGPLPCVRLGRRVMYSPQTLQGWITEQEEGAP